MYLGFELIQRKEHHCFSVPSSPRPILKMQDRSSPRGHALILPLLGQNVPGAMLLWGSAMLKGPWGALAPSTSFLTCLYGLADTVWLASCCSCYSHRQYPVIPVPCLPATLLSCPGPSLLPLQAVLVLLSRIHHHPFSLPDLKSINPASPTSAHLRAGNTPGVILFSYPRKTTPWPSTSQRTANMSKCHWGPQKQHALCTLTRFRKGFVSHLCVVAGLVPHKNTRSQMKLFLF